MENAKIGVLYGDLVLEFKIVIYENYTDVSDEEVQKQNERIVKHRENLVEIINKALKEHHASVIDETDN